MEMYTIKLSHIFKCHTATILLRFFVFYWSLFYELDNWQYMVASLVGSCVRVALRKFCHCIRMRITQNENTKRTKLVANESANRIFKDVRFSSKFNSRLFFIYLWLKIESINSFVKKNECASIKQNRVDKRINLSVQKLEKFIAKCIQTYIQQITVSGEIFYL